MNRVLIPDDFVETWRWNYWYKFPRSCFSRISSISHINNDISRRNTHVVCTILPSNSSNFLQTCPSQIYANRNRLKQRRGFERASNFKPSNSTPDDSYFLHLALSHDKIYNETAARDRWPVEGLRDARATGIKLFRNGIPGDVVNGGIYFRENISVFVNTAPATSCRRANFRREVYTARSFLSSWCARAAGTHWNPRIFESYASANCPVPLCQQSPTADLQLFDRVNPLSLSFCFFFLFFSFFPLFIISPNLPRVWRKLH